MAAKNIAKMPSSTMTMKIAFTTDEVTCRPSDSAEPWTASPSIVAMMPMTRAMKGAFDEADQEGVEPHRTPQARQEHVDADVAVEPGRDAASGERRQRRDEGQERQPDHQRQDAGNDQDFHGVEPHDPQRVDLLAHLHGPDLGREGRARTAGDHDRREEHRQFAQDEDAGEVDDERRRAELHELENALLGHDAADEERDQDDDRHPAIGDLLELIDDRRAAEAPRPCENAQQSGDELAEERRPADQVPACSGDALADVDEELDEGRVHRLGLRLEAPIGDLVEKGALFRARLDEIAGEPFLAEFMARAVEHPGPERIEPLDAAKVEDDAAPVGAFHDVDDETFDPRRVFGGPAARESCPDLVAEMADLGLRLVSQGALRHVSKGPRADDSAW